MTESQAAWRRFKDEFRRFFARLFLSWALAAHEDEVVEICMGGVADGEDAAAKILNAARHDA